MRAIVQDRYGDPALLRLADVGEPQLRDGDVLVRMRASSVHPDVWHVVTGTPAVLRLMGAGVRRPKVRTPGTDVAGVVEAVGDSVTGLRVGDEVFGETTRGFSWANGGAYAELVTAPASALAPKPAGVSFEQAAAVATTGIIALQVLTSGRVRAGHRVLVNGAAGGVGSIAVQLAKAAGAHVTGVDAGDRLDLVRALGADAVVDYTKEDFTGGGERYDVVFDVPGNHPFRRCRRVVAPGGRYVLVGHDHFGRAGRRVLGSVPRMLGLMAVSPFVAELDANLRQPSKAEALAVLRDHLASGALAPVVDRTFPLADAAAAIAYLAAGKARGKVLVTP